MLGITVPDSIALGTLILAVLAAWRGIAYGAKQEKRDRHEAQSAKDAEPPPASAMIGAVYIDRIMFDRLADSIDGLAGAIKDQTAHFKDSKQSEMMRLLQTLAQRSERD